MFKASDADTFSDEQLFAVLQIVTGMNVQMTYNFRLWPDTPWEVRYYEVGTYSERDKRLVRDSTLRGALLGALGRATCP